MTDTPSGPKIVAMYDEELASKLLKISGAEGVMSAPELSSQLKSWAEFSLRLLQDALNTDTSPTTTTLRKEPKDIADTAGGLHEKLISLSIDASMHIEHQFVDDPIEGNEVMASIISSLDALTKASAHAADALLNVKRGEKQRCNFTRADCVGELGILWRMLTGKRPTRRVHSDDSSDYKKPYGPFHDFVVTALKPIFGDKKENRGIDAVIKGVVSGMEKTLEIIGAYFSIGKTVVYLKFSAHSASCNNNEGTMHKNINDDRIVPAKERRQLIPYSDMHIWRLEKAGLFPKRIRLGENRVGWSFRELQEWISARKAERTPGVGQPRNASHPLKRKGRRCGQHRTAQYPKPNKPNV